MTAPAILFLLWVGIGLLTTLIASLAMAVEGRSKELDHIDVLLFIAFWPFFWFLVLRPPMGKKKR